MLSLEPMDRSPEIRIDDCAAIVRPDMSSMRWPDTEPCARPARPVAKVSTIGRIVGTNAGGLSGKRYCVITERFPGLDVVLAVGTSASTWSNTLMGWQAMARRRDLWAPKEPCAVSSP